MSRAVCETCPRLVTWPNIRGASIDAVRCPTCRGKVRSLNSFAIRRVHGGWMLQSRRAQVGDSVQYLHRGEDDTLYVWRDARLAIEPIDPHDTTGLARYRCLHAVDAETGAKVYGWPLRWPP